MSLRILITGAKGFLGQHVLKMIKQKGYEVVSLVRRVGATHYESEKVYDALDRLVKEEPHFDVIFHLAAAIPNDKADKPSTDFISSNIHLTSSLALHYPEAKVVFASSISVYGDPVSLPITIHSSFNNPSHYGLSKLAGEAVIGNLNRYAIIRFTSIIGCGMTQNTFVNHVIDGAKKGLILIYGDGSRQQNYIDVRDAAELCMKIAVQEKSSSLLGVSSTSFSNLEVAKIAAEATGAEIKLTGEDRSRSYLYDVENSYQSIDFEPVFLLKQTIQDMIRYE